MMNSSLAVIRFPFVLLVGFAGFSREDEILRMGISIFFWAYASILAQE